MGKYKDFIKIEEKDEIPMAPDPINANKATSDNM
jgi:hypothetical protein